MKKKWAPPAPRSTCAPGTAPAPAPAPDDADVSAARGGFPLPASSPEALWDPFLALLRARVPRPPERDIGTVAACWLGKPHVFMEFTKAVDWTGLRAVSCNGVRPNAQPTAGRGAKLREIQKHCHYDVFVNKHFQGFQFRSGSFI